MHQRRTGQLRQEVHRWVEYLGSVPIERRLVVTCGNLLIELDLSHAYVLVTTAPRSAIEFGLTMMPSKILSFQHPFHHREPTA